MFHPVLSCYCHCSEYQLLCIQCLFDICDNIFCIFDTYGQTDQVRTYTCFEQLFVCQLAVSVAGRMKHTAACISNVSNDGDELQCCLLYTSPSPRD